MKKDFEAEKAALVKEWKRKSEETALAVRNQEKEAAKQQLSKTITDYNGRLANLDNLIAELKNSVIEHR